MDLFFYKRIAFATSTDTIHAAAHGMPLSKRARGGSGEHIALSHCGVARAVDVDCSGVTPVLEELRRMCVSGMSIQKTGHALWMTVLDVVQWSVKGHTHTPDEMQEHFGRTLVLTGLEDTDMVFSRADLHVMAQTVSGLMRGCIFSGDVDLSINRVPTRKTPLLNKAYVSCPASLSASVGLCPAAVFRHLETMTSIRN